MDFEKTYHRDIEELKTTSNASVYCRQYRLYLTTRTGACHYCRPHSNENARRPARPDRYKSKRKGRC